MSKTKELTGFQFIDFWVSDCSEIKLCPDCNGQGAKMSDDRLKPAEMCQTCKYTGRIE